jgi:hypothetical protein
MSRRKIPLLLNCCICGVQFEYWTWARRFACDNPECHSALIKKQWLERKKKRMRVCVICGKEFELTKKKPRKTCSDICERESIRRSLAGKKPENWNKAYTPEAHKKRFLTLSKNPIRGRFDTHCRAKDYFLVSPEGDIYQGRNLLNFIRKNALIFEVDALSDKAVSKIAWGLNSLRPSIKKHRHSAKSWHGWTWGER